jgi:hypothetical protein
MGRFRNAIRFGLLTLLALAGLNGIMVFLFFDGTNFYGHLQALQARAAEERDAGRINRLVGRIEETRAEGNLARLKMEKSLRREYAHLDSILRSADLLLRHPLRKRDLEAGFRADHPFRVENGELAIYIGDECVYREILPPYVRMKPSGPVSLPFSVADLIVQRERSTVNPEFAFVLAIRGPVELWQAYRRFDDSTYGYYCAYYLDREGKKLSQRGVSPDRGIVP